MQQPVKRLRHRSVANPPPKPRRGEQGVAQEIPVGIYPTGVVDDQIHAGEGFETTGDLAWKPDVVLVGEKDDAFRKTDKQLLDPADHPDPAVRWNPLDASVLGGPCFEPIARSVGAAVVADLDNAVLGKFVEDRVQLRAKVRQAIPRGHHDGDHRSHRRRKS